jgi:hypothetical protein
MMTAPSLAVEGLHIHVQLCGQVTTQSPKGVTKEMAVKATINLDADITKLFASVALTTKPDTHAYSFD